MKTIPQIIALAALGLASVSAVKAQTTDLSLGFNDAAGPNSAQNDYVIDLGLSGQTLISDALASPGLTYDLSSTFVPGTFATAFSGDSADLNDVAVGVVGAITGSANPKYLYQTDLIGNTPSPINVGAFGDAAASAQTPTIGEYPSANSGGWTYSVAASPTAPGTEGIINGDDIADQSGNPLGQLSNGSLSLNLWEDTETRTGLSSTIGGWVDEGTFNINVNTDTITFTAVPEPSSYMIGGVGMIALLFLRRITRVNA